MALRSSAPPAHSGVLWSAIVAILVLPSLSHSAQSGRFAKNPDRRFTPALPRTLLASMGWAALKRCGSVLRELFRLLSFGAATGAPSGYEPGRAKNPRSCLPACCWGRLGLACQEESLAAQLIAGFAGIGASPVLTERLSDVWALSQWLAERLGFVPRKYFLHNVRSPHIFKAWIHRIRRASGDWG